MLPTSRCKLTTLFSLLIIVGLTLFNAPRVLAHATSTPLKSSPTSDYAPATRTSSCGAWSVVSSPNVGLSANELNGVATVSQKNVWAVGYTTDSITGSQSTLIEHWNGSSWKVVTSPNPSRYNQLYGITAISSSNIWAVGVFGDGLVGNGHAYQTLIEHWNGSSWNVVTSPNPGATFNVLFGITAISSSNIWAVGNYGNTNDSGVYQTLTEHWNGTAWSTVSSPSIGYSSSLEGVAAISKNNVWAVGLYFNSSGPVQTLITHWNGTTWSIVSSPNPGTGGNSLNGVTGMPGSNHLWAVGRAIDGVSQIPLTLIEEWNGTSWTVVASPNVGTNQNNLYGVVAISTTNVWAVGDDLNSNANYSHQTLIEHWNGTTWSIVSSPNPGTINILNGVARIPRTNQVWAVGYKTDSSTGTLQTLTEFYC